MRSTASTSRLRLSLLSLTVVVTASVALLALLSPGTSHAATFTVTSTANSGAGSLRQAIIDSNAAGAGNTIDFSIAGAGPHTIALASFLPPITEDGTIIDGTTEPDDVGTPVVVLGRERFRERHPGARP